MFQIIRVSELVLGFYLGMRRTKWGYGCIARPTLEKGGSMSVRFPNGQSCKIAQSERESLQGNGAESFLQERADAVANDFFTKLP